MALSDAAPDLNLLAALRTATFKYLRPVSAALGAFYATMTLIDLITLSGRVAVTSAAVAGASAVLLLGLHVVLKQRPTLAHWADPIATGVAAVVLANSLVALQLTADPQHVAGLIILTVGSGLLLRPTLWFAGVLVAVLAGFGTIAGLNPPVTSWLPSAGGLLAASALSVFIHAGWQQTFQQIETLRRTASHQEAELEDAHQELAKQNTELLAIYAQTDSLAHRVGHDLRGPLGNIFSYAILLEKQYGEWPEDLVRRSLRAVATSAQRMINILDQVLLLTGLRVADPEMVALDISSITHESLNSLGHMVDEHKPVIIQPERWPTVLGHAAWVKEVWRNYLSNAMEYGRKPPRVELGFDVQSDGFVRFWVRDDGQGLSSEEQIHLFSPFSYQDIGGASGDGLGLSILPQIVGKMGGKVGVESQKGAGSTFWFTLPVAEDT
ncbi:MAG: HAMP domain-containing histidine kinase [Anaerolineae bacterium]|nr:HAMP domain-containing histidine kinase [Anaerolineae bacterium]